MCTYIFQIKHIKLLLFFVDIIDYINMNIFILIILVMHALNLLCTFSSNAYISDGVK